MSLLNHSQIALLLDQGVLTGGQYSAINSASIDIHLGNKILVEQRPQSGAYFVDYSKRDPLYMNEVDLTKGVHGFVLEPGQFILAQSKEVFNLPLDVSAEYKLKSSMARIGIDHANAGWCFTGETRVPMLDGTVKRIDEVQQGEYVYSIKSDGDICSGKVVRAGVSGHVTDTIRVTLDDGGSFECTPNHKVMLRNGEYVEAQALTPGTPLMPWSRKYLKTGHELVYCPHMSERGNWKELYGAHKPTHRLIAGVTDRSVVHHVNGNPRDNRPENLEILTAQAHTAHHNVLRNKSEEGRAVASRTMRDTNHRLWADPDYRKAQSEIRKENAVGWNESLWSDEQHRKAMRATQAENGRKTMARVGQAVMQSKAKLGALKKAISVLLSSGKAITPDAYVAVKRQNAPTVATLEREFGSFEEAVALTGYSNHTVKEVQRVHREVAIPVYDLTMEGEHNFALECGVFVHNCDAGWHGSVLTLELKNITQHHSIILHPGDPIGQMIFFRHDEVELDNSYAMRGRYNGDTAVSGIKK